MDPPLGKDRGTPCHQAMPHSSSRQRALSASRGGMCGNDHSLDEKPGLREVNGLPEVTPASVELGSDERFLTLVECSSAPVSHVS